MMPKTRVLDVVRGDAYVSPTETVWDENGEAVDITGWTFVAEAKRLPSDEAPAFAFGVEKVDAAQGTYRLTLDPADTEALPVSDLFYGPTPYRFDVERTDDADPTKVVTEISGAVLVYADVS